MDEAGGIVVNPAGESVYFTAWAWAKENRTSKWRKAIGVKALSLGVLAGAAYFAEQFGKLGYFGVALLPHQFGY